MTVFQASHTPLFRRATHACVERVTENMALSRNPSAKRAAPETRHEHVVVDGQMLYTRSQNQVIATDNQRDS